MIKLGILDIGALPKLNQTEEVIEHTIAACQLAEKLGFTRYWIGEHHSINTAWRNPEIMISLMGNYTNTIRIGSAGVLLPVHSPLSVAQNFKLLNLIFPERIDLGICKGSVENYIAIALNNGDFMKENLIHHSERFLELLKYIKNEDINEYPKEKVVLTPPYNSSTPEIWILTGSDSSTELAINNRVNISFSKFHINNSVNPYIIENYINNYRLANNEPPKINLAISGIVCKNKKEAEISTRKALKTSYLNCTISGTPDEFAETVYQIKKEYNITEIIFLNLDQNLERKLKSYELIAEIMNLTKNQ